MRYIIILLLIIQASVVAMADAIGTWRLYNCYSDIQQIQPAGDDVFVLASGNLYSYNTKDNSLTTYDKTTCLNSNDITRIAWVQQAKRLVIAYSNHSIDFLSLNQNVVNINDLADKQMAGDKTLNDIYVSGKYAYLSTGFGIVKINVTDAYIVDTYNLGCKVDYCYIEGSTIYAASSTNGLLSAALNANLLDKNVWSRVGDYTPKTIEAYTYDAHNNCYWGANADSQLTKYKKLDDGPFEQNTAFFPVKPDGPVSNSFWRLYKHDGSIFCTTGIFSAGLGVSNPGLVQIYDSSAEKWSQLTPPSDDVCQLPYLTMNCMAFDPKNANHFWVGGYSGLYEYLDYKCIKAYNSSNSTLQPVYNTIKTGSVISSMSYDLNHNLWVMNGWSDIPVQCYKANGEWESFPMQGYDFAQLNTIDEQGLYYSNSGKCMWWVHSYYNTPVLYRMFDDAKTIIDIKQFVTEDGEKLAPEYLYSLCEDKNENLWIATSSGPLYLSKDRISSGDYIFTKHKVPRSDGTNYADYLLDGINIRTIKIDAANQKWMGTAGSGVYLISADNNTQVHHFTKDNSNLLSDYIYDIFVDDVDGTIYFATDRGLCSFKGDVTDSNETMSDESVYAFPNPVTSDFSGDITIVGLQLDSQIIITTSSGQKIAEGVCSGGSFRWNGCDTSGRKVASGVYMVNIANKEGKKTLVTKIAIIR